MSQGAAYTRDATCMTEIAGSEHLALELAQLRWLEVASLVEATTLILLIGVAVPLKHLAGQPLGVTVMGPVHGIAFCFYVWTVVQTITGGGWTRPEWMRLVVTAFVPIAGHTNLPLIRRKMFALRLGGGQVR